MSINANNQKVASALQRNHLSLPSMVKKRDGRIVPFDLSRITKAMENAYETAGEASGSKQDLVQVVANLLAMKDQDQDTISVDTIHDAVENTLVMAGDFIAARSYIRFREMRSQTRGAAIPPNVREAFENDAQHFPSQLQQFQFYDKYSRFNWEHGRRETWSETVARTVDYLRVLSDSKLPEETFDRLGDAILHMRVMPSMRALAMAGPPALRNSMAIYNCSALPISDIQAFVEILLISMAGCGVGFSVESEFVEQFPRIRRQKKTQDVETHQIEDSTEGWGEALKLGLTKWWAGEDVKFNFDLIRRAGSPLRVKGGRASGPEPLKAMLDFIRGRLLARQGSFLKSIDALDIACMIGTAAVSGGVRRTAMICLFDSWDNEVRNCKNGSALIGNEQRWNANISAVWPENIQSVEVMRQMLEMAEGNRGEPGIFSRDNANRLKPKRRTRSKFLVNPCGEINLRPYGLCNLSIVVARSNDTRESLLEKVELATIIGTIQSLGTNFPGMRPEWKQNAEEERLLGVDITGQLDCPLIFNDETGMLLQELKQHAVATNAQYAELLGINQSAAVTCNKPSGNSSQLLNCASGIHARWAPFYIRNVRVSAQTPLYRVLRDAGVPMDPENGQRANNADTWVVHFPVKSPEGAVTRSGRSAIVQCEYWLLNKVYWAEHNVSCTVTYQPDELIDLSAWVWDHRHLIGGLSFLPASNQDYGQMPYEEISQEHYEELAASFPVIDFTRLYAYETEDLTTAAQEIACSAGHCDL